MASTGSSDQEQKNAAADDLRAAGVDAAATEDENKQDGNMKEIIMPQCEVDFVLSYEPEPCDPGTAAWMEAFDPDLFALVEDLERRMLAEQEDFKRQIALKGYVSMMVEVTNDDDDDDDNDEEDEDEDCVLDHEPEEDSVLDHEPVEEPKKN